MKEYAKCWIFPDPVTYIIDVLIMRTWSRSKVIPVKIHIRRKQLLRIAYNTNVVIPRMHGMARNPRNSRLSCECADSYKARNIIHTSMYMYTRVDIGECKYMTLYNTLMSWYIIYYVYTCTCTCTQIFRGGDRNLIVGVPIALTARSEVNLDLCWVKAYSIYM